MNIIYIHTHDTGRYIQPYGYNIPTPHLQEFAKDATLFRKAFTVSPTCSPSRGSLLTGMYPHQNGLMGLTHRGFKIDNYQNHLVNYLKKHNFHTVLAGMQHECIKSSDIGYDDILLTNLSFDNITKICEDGTFYDDRNVDLAIDYLQQYNQDKPLFFSMGFWSTHRAFPDIDEQYNSEYHPLPHRSLTQEEKFSIDQRYIQVPNNIMDSAENRNDWADFLLSAKLLDNNIGRFIQTLKENGLYENSIIFFTTDHGIPYPNKKCTMYEDGIGVSLIMRTPNSTSRGKVIDTMISQIDIFPSICDLLNIEKPNYLEGISFASLFEEQPFQRSEIFAEVNFHASYEPMRMIRTNEYKYIRYFYQNYLKQIFPHIDNSPEKKRLFNHHLGEYTHAPEYLFDLRIDPSERENLINHPAYQDIKRELIDKLDIWMHQTNDPLLQGNLKLPKEASLQAFDAYDYKSHGTQYYQ